MRILQWLGVLVEDAPATSSPALAAIEQRLESLDPARARFVAGFAYLLGRVARADHDVSEAEAVTMRRLVEERGGLPPEQAALAVEIATLQGLRHGGTEDFLVSRELDALATVPEKLALLDCLFAVSAADAAIRTVEDNEIRRIAAELHIGHQDYIAVRARHVTHLEVLRGRTPATREDGPR